MELNRRQFIGTIGTGAVGSVGFSRAATAQEPPVVGMGNNYFDPIGLHIDPGTTVRFEIRAGAHSATAYANRIPAAATAFDSGVISSGGVEYTFEELGTYDYYCIPHQSVGMVGRIVVGSPGGPAEASPIPDGDVPDSDVIVERSVVPSGANDDGSGTAGGGMMGPGMDHGPGMMDRRNRGWYGGLPFVGGALGTLGVVSALLYWAVGQGRPATDSDDSAMATLRRRYARGDIDDAEFERRRELLIGGQED